MQYWIKICSLLLISFVIISCNNNTSETTVAEVQAPKQLAPSANSESFNRSFHRLLTDYSDLRKALIDWDTAAANTAAAALVHSSDSLDLNQLANDTSGALKNSASNLAATMNGSAKAIPGESDIQAKRKEFQMISNALYELAVAVKYDRETLYHMKCPMAFNDSEEAFWISDHSGIENPYLGNKHPKYKNKMLECGEVTDSIGAR